MRMLMNGGPAIYKWKQDMAEIYEKHPRIRNSFEFLQMTPHEQQNEQFAKLKYIDQNVPHLFTETKLNNWPYHYWANQFL
jgi:hypothetical protein